MSSRKKVDQLKQPFRVLMVTGIYPSEAVPHSGTFIKTQVEALRAQGFEVDVIHPRPGPIPVRYVTATLQVFLKTFGRHYDVVNGHYGLWCLAARLQWTTPVVASYLGGDLLGKLKADGTYSKKAAFVVQVSRVLGYLVDAVIVKSEEMKKRAHGRRIVVIPNGVDFELFRPIPRAEARAALGWDPDRMYVLFGNDPGRPEKNFSLAQASVERLRKRGIDAEIVVANGLLQSTVVQYMNASNVLLLSSVYEGSPNSVKEAMACNVPIVATNVGDVAQLIGQTAGCKVCPPDPEALADGLEEAIGYGEPTTGREDIKHLENSIVARQIIAIYEQITGKKVCSQ
jgi:teichuronic acid biosynthesis glycosyltransferase TuaC